MLRRQECDTTMIRAQYGSWVISEENTYRLHFEIPLQPAFCVQRNKASAAAAPDLVFYI